LTFEDASTEQLWIITEPDGDRFGIVLG